MFDFKNLWTNFPNRDIGGMLKWYTLVQFAFWVQQILVLHIEERRKDHSQMFAHHIITTILIFCSYHYHQTKVGHLIMTTMDTVDLFFPVLFPILSPPLPTKGPKSDNFLPVCKMPQISWLQYHM